MLTRPLWRGQCLPCQCRPHSWVALGIARELAFPLGASVGAPVSHSTVWCLFMVLAISSVGDLGNCCCSGKPSRKPTVYTSSGERVPQDRWALCFQRGCWRLFLSGSIFQETLAWSLAFQKGTWPGQLPERWEGLGNPGTELGSSGLGLRQLAHQGLYVPWDLLAEKAVHRLLEA